MTNKKNRVRQSQKWLKIHELKVLKVYKQIKDGGNQNELFKELAQDEVFLKQGISEGSIKMKYQNIKYLDEGVGLRRASKLKKDIFLEYGNCSVEELKWEIEKMENQQ